MSKHVPKIYGVVGEFSSAEAILEAAKHATEAGYTHAEAYTPFPVEGLAEALNFYRSPVALCTLLAGILGGATGFFMCWYANVISYAWDVGGRPRNSWPAWIPITFELTVLFAALTAAISMLVLNGLPRLHHPIFETPHFTDASRDRFFLCIEAKDPKFTPETATTFLTHQGALAVSEVME
ncbi:MAG TPA: DUF3341 domain-containing protein [Phycisphaerae bacterium]|nr:DUF3341 domain-containing protein [Phycisphaerae bacterium]